MIAHLTILWVAAILLFVPPLTCVLGTMRALVPAYTPPALLSVCCMTACVLVSALFAFIIKRIGPQLRPYLPSSFQTLVIVLFAACVTFPRLIALGPDMPLAVYDDNWHYQKMVSIFSSFPDFTHYLFPEFTLSYYFYGYVIPAAAYTIKAGINLKIIWAGYLFVLIFALYTLILTCGNRLLPDSGRCRTLFALMITFLGGLHEWPALISARARGLQDWHTEWWAQGIGLDLQISSPYTACFWAPQHICGLALFALVLVLLNAAGSKRSTYLMCGLLVGVQAGFSAYVALATLLYAILFLIRPHEYRLRTRLLDAANFGAGCALALLPIAECFIGRQDNIALAPRFALLPEYVFFLCAEFGVLLILPVLYAVRTRSSTYRRTALFVDSVFITTMFIILVCVRSSGFNVISYRMLLPAQVLLAIYAAQQLERWRAAGGFLKRVLAVVLLIQLSGFVPEMTAMSKKHYDVRTGTVRLPDAVVAINRSRPLNDVIAIPYSPKINSVWHLNTLINNLFRQKNVDKRFFCEGTLYYENCVYLTSRDIAALQAACEAVPDTAGLPEPAQP